VNRTEQVKNSLYLLVIFDESKNPKFPDGTGSGESLIFCLTRFYVL